jgi:DNA-binding transcriptional MerR regulator
MAPEIPNRSLFKAPEVCEIAQVQPYVLRSWESEFPDLGVTKSAGTARVYRRADVERVLRIKHLLFVEGLTLAGARRKLQEESPSAESRAAGEPDLKELLGRDARERVLQVRQGLRSLLDLLSGRSARAAVAEFTLRQEGLPAARGNGAAKKNGRARKAVVPPPRRPRPAARRSR